MPQAFTPSFKQKTQDRFLSRVHKTDGCWEWTGYVYPTGYSSFSGEGHKYAHRFSYELYKGSIPEGMHIDHICHNTGCVNPDHLRAVTRKQNNEHRRGAQSNSKTGIRNVHRVGPKSRPYLVQVGHNKKIVRRGPFATLAEAEATAIALRKSLFTHDDMALSAY